MRTFGQFVTETAKFYYHGSHSRLTRFRTPDERPDDDPIPGHPVGIYFTDNPKFAALFGKFVHQVKLSFHKPLDLTHVKLYADLIKAMPIGDQDQHEAKMTGVVSHFNNLKQDFYRAIEMLDRKFEVISKLRAQGYDALVFPDWENTIYGTTTVVFDPAQIKIQAIY